MFSLSLFTFLLSMSELGSLSVAIYGPEESEYLKEMFEVFDFEAKPFEDWLGGRRVDVSAKPVCSKKTTTATSTAHHPPVCL